MDPKTYREEMLAKMRGVEAFGGASDDDVDVDALLETAADTDLSVNLRLQAIAEINRVAFDLVAFQEHNADYREVLKELRSDSSSKVRQAAFERLALTMDADTRDLLQRSLAGDGDQLVPDKLAVMLLGKDDHASSRDILRAMTEREEKGIRQVAIRGLASDPGSAALLERIATDSNEDAEVREFAAISLKAASPDRFADMVEKLAVDPREDDRLRATALASLAHSDEALSKVGSETFLSQLDDVAKETKSRALKSSIKRLKSRKE